MEAPTGLARPGVAVRCAGRPAVRGEVAAAYGIIETLPPGCNDTGLDTVVAVGLGAEVLTFDVPTGLLELRPGPEVDTAVNAVATSKPETRMADR